MQGVYFTDPETGLQRELDVLITSGLFNQNNHIAFKIHIPIQCKYSSKPWVVFASHTSSVVNRDYVINACFKNEAAYNLIYHLCQTSEIQPNPYLFETPINLGYGITTAHSIQESDSEVKSKEKRGGKDHAYESYMSVIQACRDLQTRASKNKDAHGFIPIEVIFPLLVIDGPLYEMSLNGNGDVSFSEIDEATIIYRGIGSSFVRVISAKIMDERLGLVAKSVNSIVDHVTRDQTILWRDAPFRLITY